MARTHEPVAVLGIGTMGHGMATSALRAGLPTIVWNREPKATRDLADLGAEVAGIERVAALAAEERPDITLLDAPVSGSKEPAARGELTIFASGPDSARV